MWGESAKRFAAQAEWIETTLIYLNAARESFVSLYLPLGEVGLEADRLANLSGTGFRRGWDWGETNQGIQKE